MRKILLIGGGGHARSVIEAMGASRFAGYAALKPAEIPLQVPYLGDDADMLSGAAPEDIDIHIAMGFGTGGSLALRRKIIQAYAEFYAPALIAPTALVTPASTIGPGTAVMARAIVNRSAIGSHCVINTGAIIEHDCHLGENVFIGPGAILCGEVTVGHDVFIGAGAIIKQGVHIPDATVIGMGAVIVSSPTEAGTYVGSPAHLINHPNH